MSERRTLSLEDVDAAVVAKLVGRHASTVDRVIDALAAHPIVVVGMRQNPHVKRARKALEAAGHHPHYIEIGSYLGEWSPRLAIKMWSGWPTFPQVFVCGRLIGGADECERAIGDGSIAKSLAIGR